MRGVRDVGGVCEMCMCFARGDVGALGGEWIGFGLYQTCRNKGSVRRAFVLGDEWVGGLVQGLGGWVVYVL